MSAVQYSPVRTHAHTSKFSPKYTYTHEHTQNLTQQSTHRFDEKQRCKKKFYWFGLIKQLLSRVWWSGLKDDFVDGHSHSEKAPLDVHQKCVVTGQHVFDHSICSRLKEVWTSRNIRYAGLVISFVLCFSTDGFNPWKGSPYTMWFLCVKILNYKPKPGSKTSNLIVVGLVSGPRAPKQFHWYTSMVI